MTTRGVCRPVLDLIPLVSTFLVGRITALGATMDLHHGLPAPRWSTGVGEPDASVVFPFPRRNVRSGRSPSDGDAASRLCHGEPRRWRCALARASVSSPTPSAAVQAS